jgi:hypothetical protein
MIDKMLKEKIREAIYKLNSKKVENDYNQWASEQIKNDGIYGKREFWEIKRNEFKRE